MSKPVVEKETPVMQDTVGFKAFSSVKDIHQYLENPQLLNMKNQPTRLVDP